MSSGSHRFSHVTTSLVMVGHGWLALLLGKTAKSWKCRPCQVVGVAFRSGHGSSKVISEGIHWQLGDVGFNKRVDDELMFAQLNSKKNWESGRQYYGAFL